MPTITTTDESPISLHYTDSGGDGRPVVLMHGWPLSGEAFADNVAAFVDAGHRVITYDRRGFGRSDKPDHGYDYETLANDLNDVLATLHLESAVLVGFSMGGGEVAQYLAHYGSSRVDGAVLSGSICPALCLQEDNPDGAMPIEAFIDMAEQCRADHPGFLDQFVTNFFSNNEGLTVDESVRQDALQIALQSDPEAAARCIIAWATDFRHECAQIDVPVLVIHGDGDQNVPLAKSSKRAVDLIPDAELIVVPGGPHGLNVANKDVWEGAILDFIARL